MVWVLVLVVAVLVGAKAWSRLVLVCPPRTAMVITRSVGSPSLRPAAPSFRVCAQGHVLRTPAVGSVDLLDLSPVRVETFLGMGDSARTDLQAVLSIQVSRRKHQLRCAARMLLGMSRVDLEEIGVSALSIAVNDVVGGRRAVDVARERHQLEGEIRTVLGELLEQLGLEIVDLQLKNPLDSEARMGQQKNFDGLQNRGQPWASV